MHLVVEPEPLGSAGTVAANRSFVEDADSFWVFYADNLTNLRLGPMREAHERHRGVLTLGLFRAPDPRAAGIASGVSNGHLDDLYATARRAGAVGGKISGAGGGGCLLLFVEPDSHCAVRRAMMGVGLREVPFAIDPEGSRIVHYSD